ncbi:hypothetical protein L873DRAFT_1785931 [Choiromyces venosus 120613-1]|uniref:CCHC-type domain-containing protein n=1 Tax=Choiromyces venosus 120613-1 TaxID=1336337 RepID=A0A3N4KHI3_9PEZI|nr:hypothetical protein L873DRAFT_1785931 [Choiromyces venosus 120613-1]
MPLCFSSVQVELEPEVTARRSQIVIERRKVSTHNRKIPVPVVYPPPPPAYLLQPQYTHTDTQIVLAAPPPPPQEQESSTILNINIQQAASEIAENLATENMLRNQVAVLENSLDEEREAKRREESARYRQEIDKIYEEREARHRSRSREEQREFRSREVSVEWDDEEAARRRISREFHQRSSSTSRLPSPRRSGDRLMIMNEHPNPRHSADRLLVSQTRYHSHEIRYHRCRFCNQHGHRSSDCTEGDAQVVQVPVGRVRYWAV